MQEQTGWLDLHARFYDPTIGRFLTIDPLTETQEQLSPYHYGYDNPLRFSDPDGMYAQHYEGEDAQYAFSQLQAKQGGGGPGNMPTKRGDDPPKKEKKVGSIFSKTVHEVETGLIRAGQIFTETGKGIDKEVLGGAISDASQGDYSTAAIAILMSRAKVPGLNSFSDIKKIAKFLGVARKGKGQYEIVGASMKEIFAELKKSGFNITGYKAIGEGKTVFMANSAGEKIIIRYSKDGKYSNFDSISGMVSGVQTDIRVPLRR